MAKRRANRKFPIPDSFDNSMDFLLSSKGYYNIYPHEEILVLSPHRILLDIGVDKEDFQDETKCLKAMNKFIKEHEKELDDAPRPTSYIHAFPILSTYIERSNVPNPIDAINILGRVSDNLYIPNRKLRFDSDFMSQCYCFLKKEYEKDIMKGEE